MNNTAPLKIMISSDIDYEYLIAEIYCGDIFIALLQQEHGVDDIRIEFSSDINTVNLDWFQNALNEAKKKLLNQ
ncbi:hypothetical protein BTJ39_23950 [Izhakiella australiensis]|uniref:Uncharacterized protein n=1 Tax=Izhakiella australiensis TaxID=1926881 RepID=A0A1S8Y383_9GAMM|nr:hypothetical protein [Izhakiella australiensis]OON33561.1 hypothetical protein BTJ39_23950 [Izhakiella australiensis]